MENLVDDLTFFSLLKISQYPLPRKKLKKIFKNCDELLVVEEGYPLVEELLRDYFDESTKVTGKLSGHLPQTGELNPVLVARAIGLYRNQQPPAPDLVVNRPPQLCEGCGHLDLFKVIQEVLPDIGEKRVFGDIGCYALGASSPLNTVNSLIDMGASITMAKGAADAGLKNAIAVIGDSTFTHSGMTGLLEAVNEASPITVIISDNSAVAMTGAQESSATGRLNHICLGLGVDPEHVKMIEPLKKNFEKNVEILKKEVLYQGVSVIISERPCVRLSRDQKEIVKQKIATLN
jgi:indolepyruvate ferredoxin oxidoreductase alpha subunit